MARVKDASMIEKTSYKNPYNYRLFYTKQRSCTKCKKHVYVLEPPNLREPLFFICFRCKKVYEDRIGDEVPRGRRICPK